MKAVNNNREKILKILVKTLMVLLLFYVLIMTYNYYLLNKYKNRMYNNTYINNYNISNMKIKDIYKKIDDIENSELNKKIIFKTKDKKIEYKLKDMGVKINSDNLKIEIKNYHRKEALYKRIKKIIRKDKKIFTFNIVYNQSDIRNFVEKLKEQIDVDGHDGRLIMDNNRNLVYEEKVVDYKLNVDKTYTELIKYLDNGFIKGELELVVDIKDYSNNDDLKTINTKVSTYTTNYNAYISRGRNLENALRNLDGTIVKSGEVFSYFKVAGPYNKNGYVYYDKVIGNGVCQIASTMYNTVLLGGLEVVERYQHQKHMPYVPSGLDATVVSNGSYNALDFKFKNTYKYPIYISAYYYNGKATIDFWSNSNAKDGKEYKTSFVSLGNNTYESYLHVYKEGREIEVKKVAKSRYIDY